MTDSTPSLGTAPATQICKCGEPFTVERPAVLVGEEAPSEALRDQIDGAIERFATARHLATLADGQVCPADRAAALELIAANKALRECIAQHVEVRAKIKGLLAGRFCHMHGDPLFDAIRDVLASRSSPGTPAGETPAPSSSDVTGAASEGTASDAAVAPVPNPGVGMPHALYLDEFGSQVRAAFGHYPYLVGSALLGKKWRDIDVRLILPDEEYAALFGGDTHTHRNGKWVSLVLAYAALGKAMTGLPIDFQIQQRTKANDQYLGPRSALGIVPLRLKAEI